MVVVGVRRIRASGRGGSVAAKNLKVGSLVAPVWPGTVGDSAMGDEEARKKFVLADVDVNVRVEEEEVDPVESLAVTLPFP